MKNKQNNHNNAHQNEKNGKGCGGKDCCGKAKEGNHEYTHGGNDD